MTAFNIITATALGILAVVIWSLIAVRRSLRAPRFANLSPKHRGIVWLGVAVAFVPAIYIGFLGFFLVSRFTVGPGPWVHIAMSLTQFFSIAVFGTLVIWLVALGIAGLITGWARASGRGA